MKFSLRLNNDLTIPEYLGLARLAEGAGFDQFWVSDDLFLRSAMVILTAVAGATTRIGIGTCIVNPYTLHPAEMAMFAATLDEYSGGRFSPGRVGGGGRFPALDRRRGCRAAHRRRRDSRGGQPAAVGRTGGGRRALPALDR
jgi:5,10-methylenetetrahydromethanopterin reductase